MEMRFLGGTGVRVSVLCLGTMTFGKNQWQMGNMTLPEVKEAIKLCLDAGVNFIDTADVYSYGESEDLLGQAIQGIRKDLIIATKVRMRMSDKPNDIGLSRHHILESCDASLKRLRTDYIDLYQVHIWDPVTPLEETLRALDDLVRWGKVRYIGVSNYAAWQIMKALWVSDRHGWVRFQSLQALYNLAIRDIEVELVPLCQDQNLGILPWSPLAFGLLSGKYRRNAPMPQGTRMQGPLKDFLPTDWDRVYNIVDVLDEIAKGHGVPVAAVALAWLIQKPAVTSVIIGARTLDQLRENLKAAEVKLSQEEMKRLDEVSARPMPYPQWMIATVGQDR
ncbi:Oxidoreductase [Thermogutta terrifontis]|uniref:Oxidoreductase n=1 Tax=Thermogutta terrifontis TaxID=1331910 RepID=A0A286RJ77_9BACT|nr:aldo/keto reductase [Thermogutta terrifontis]ASV75972.1 Oxidoreductase [Thermogutta terrifontis]